MDNLEKISQLQEGIHSKLDARINRDFWLLEVPYYTNTGDTLIWQGELDFLKSLGHSCMGMYSFDSPKCPSIPNGSLVLFQGGGNFGDMYNSPHGYRKKIMARNPTCQFVIFPQTVYWSNRENYFKDAEFFSQFDCVICARDLVSYDVLRKAFKNEILLVPDLAFCINMNIWRRKWHGERCGKELLLLRNDDERLVSPELGNLLLRNDIEIRDWPSFDRPSGGGKLEIRVRRILRKLPSLFDWYMQSVVRARQIRSGIEFLDSFMLIHTTRLHACILSILLDKREINLYDNSYGKLSSFYRTWLGDLESVRLIHA